MYEYNKTRAGLGALPPRANRRNLPPGMGWTGGFTVPGNETRFSMRSCSGSAANPMPSDSDLICGRAGEVDYLNRIGCTAVGFQGSHHCLTGAGNEGLFFCCPPGVLDNARTVGGGQDSAPRSVLPSGALLGVGMVAAVGVGLVVWDQLKKKREDEAESYYGYDF